MSCWPPGDYQRLTHGALSLDLLHADGVFDSQSANGQTLLEQIGYDRYKDPNRLARSQYGPQGANLWTGNTHETYVFQWQLQLLSDLAYYTLKAIADNARAAREPVIFDDHLYWLDESAPRTHGKIAPDPIDTPTITGRVFFYPRFNIELRLDESQWNHNGDGWRGPLTAIEYNPHRTQLPDA